MTEEGTEVIRRMLAAFNRDDVGAVVAAFHQDCELQEPREVPDRPAAGFHGHEGIRKWMANLRETAGVEFELTSVVAGEDPVVCELASRGRGEASGAPVEWTTFAVFHLRDGKIATVQAFLGEAEALEAAGIGGLSG